MNSFFNIYWCQWHYCNWSRCPLIDSGLPQTLWAKSQTIVSKFLLIVTSNPFLQLLIKYLRSFDVFGGLYVDIQWISGTILGQCQHLGMLKYLKIMRNAISTLTRTPRNNSTWPESKRANLQYIFIYQISMY